MKSTLMVLLLCVVTHPLWAEQSDLDAQLKEARKELELARFKSLQHTDGRSWQVLFYTEVDGSIIFKDANGRMQNFKVSELKITPPNAENLQAAEKKFSDLEKQVKNRASKVDLDALNLEKLPPAERQAKMNLLQGLKAKPEFVDYMSKLEFESVEDAGMFVMYAVPAPRGMELQLQFRQNHSIRNDFSRDFRASLNFSKVVDREWFWRAAVMRFAIRESEQQDMMNYVPPENAIAAETSVQTAMRKAMREQILKMQAERKEKEKQAPAPAAPKP